MTNEVIIVELLGDGGDPVEYTVSSSTIIEKGTLLALTDPRTAAANTAATALSQVWAGVAAAEKTTANSDASTTLAAYTNFIGDVVASGSITVGQPVKAVAANKVMAASYLDIASGVICGKALETASDLEVFQVKFGGIC